MARLALSFGLLSVWLALLLLGWSLGGAVYLLLGAAVAIFPWRLLRPDGTEPATWATPEDVAPRSGDPADEPGSATGR